MADYFSVKFSFFVNFFLLLNKFTWAPKQIDGKQKFDQKIICRKNVSSNNYQSSMVMPYTFTLCTKLSTSFRFDIFDEKLFLLINCWRKINISDVLLELKMINLETPIYGIDILVWFLICNVLYLPSCSILFQNQIWVWF